MFNYIHAEFYKLFRRKYTWIMLILLLLGELFLVSNLAYAAGSNPMRNFTFAMEAVRIMLPVGLFATLFSADIVFAGQYKNSTMKNEVSFGLSRTRTYLGKLLSQILLSLLALFAAMAFYSILCWLLLPHSGGVLPGLQTLAGMLLSALPIWIGTQAIICAFLFSLNSGTAAQFATLGLLYVPSIVIQVVTMITGLSPLTKVLLKINPWLLDVSLTDFSYGLHSDSMRLWIIGGFWLLAATATGLYLFRKKEIK